MVEAFIASLLALVMSIVSVVSGNVPASQENNPSDEARSANSAVVEYVEENHPTGNEPSDITPDTILLADSNANLGVSGIAPEEPKGDGQAFGQSVSSGANADNPAEPEVDSNSDFGSGIADSQPDASKTDGRAFGTNTSDSRIP